MSNPSEQFYDLKNISKIKDIKSSLCSVYEYLDSRSGQIAVSSRLKNMGLSSGIATTSDLENAISNLQEEINEVSSDLIDSLSNDINPRLSSIADLLSSQSNQIAAKADLSSLATVATTGSYNDLSDLPTIPEANDGVLTIQRNGTALTSFSANQSSSITANITVPTKTSDLTNDSNFVASTALTAYVQKTTTVNGQQLTGDIVLNAASVSAATEAFVLENITQGTAIYRGSYATKAALTSIAWQTTVPEASYYVSNNDYAVVQDDESNNDECWRYIYVTGTGWTPQYMINESPLTQAQLSALNSGATSEIITSVAAKISAVIMNGSTKFPTNGVVDLGTVLSGTTAPTTDVSLSGNASDAYDTGVALSGKASREDATLNMRGFGPWVVTPPTIVSQGLTRTLYVANNEESGLSFLAFDDAEYGQIHASTEVNLNGLTTYTWAATETAFGESAIATRTALPGYILGPNLSSNPNFDKPLQPAGDYAWLSDIVEPIPPPVSSVNGQTGIIVLNAADVSAIPNAISSEFALTSYKINGEALSGDITIKTDEDVYLDYETVTSLSLVQSTDVYRMTLTADGVSAVFPEIDPTSIPNRNAYYRFEMEITVPSGVTTMTFPSCYEWLNEDDIPEPGLVEGKTIYIAARFDCAWNRSDLARSTLINIWRIK